MNRLAPNPPSEVRTASIRNGRGLKVRARSSGITLDETTQGAIGVVLTVGTTRYCSLFAGPAVVRDQVARFQAKNAPARRRPSRGRSTTRWA